MEFQKISVTEWLRFEGLRISLASCPWI